MRSEIVVLLLGSFVRLEAIALGKYRSSLENGPASTASLAGIRTIAHGLAGTGRVFGFDDSAKPQCPDSPGNAAWHTKPVGLTGTSRSQPFPGSRRAANALRASYQIGEVRTTVGISTHDHLEAMLQGLVRRSDGPQQLLLPEDEGDDVSHTVQRRAARAAGSRLSSPEK